MLAFAVTASCTCLTPVVEGDGGTAGGGAAGGAAGGTAGGAAGSSGGGGGCATEASCSGAGPSLPFCGPAGGAGWSCIDARCLWECNGGRTCTTRATPDGGCITCAGTTSCRDRFCTAEAFTLSVEHTSCALPFDVLTAVSDGGCVYAAAPADGGAAAGTFERLASSDFLASFPAAGGACTGTGLPTGVERWVFNCPTCQFILRR